MTDTDHEEFRRYDLKTGRYSIVRFGEKDWDNESTSPHFAYCNNGIVVLTRHGQYVRTDPNGVPCPPPRGIRRLKDDAGGVFRVGHDGVVTKIISEQDHRASRLKLVPGWSAAYFAVKTVNGDVRIYDMDCKQVHHVRLSKTHPDFVADDLFVTYVWADDETIVCKNRISEGKYGMQVPRRAKCARQRPRNSKKRGVAVLGSVGRCASRNDFESELRGAFRARRGYDHARAGGTRSAAVSERNKE